MPKKEPGGKPKKGGRPPHVPTDESRRRIELLAGMGSPQSEIALIEQIGEDTLRKYYRDELDRGEAVLNGKLRQAQVSKALKGDTTMLIWLGKQRLGQKDKGSMEHTGKDGGPIQMSFAERIAARQRMAHGRNREDADDGRTERE